MAINGAEIFGWELISSCGEKEKLFGLRVSQTKPLGRDLQCWMAWAKGNRAAIYSLSHDRLTSEHLSICLKLIPFNTW